MRYTLAALALHLSAAIAYPSEYGYGSGRVLYFQDNDPSGNSIISIKVSDENGKLSSAVRTSTGGRGLAGVFAPSQDSVRVSGNYLFAVNVGSNTLSAFAIDPRDPLHPRLIGKPAATLGHNPISVAYSQRLNTACAVNGGSDLAGITCFSVHPEKGLTRLGPMRPISRSGLANAPPGTVPVLITGDLVFNPSETALFTSVINPNNGPGTLLAYPVVRGEVSETPVNSTLKDLDVVFSLNFLETDSRLFVTNPHNKTPGAALLNISPSFKAAEAEIVTIPGQEASCWVANSQESDSLFVMDVLRPTITIVDPNNGHVKSQFEFTTPSFGAIDTVADRQFLYTLTVPFNTNATAPIAPPQVLVWDVSPVKRQQTPRQIQSFDIVRAVGHIPDLFGLAIYPAN